MRDGSTATSKMRRRKPPPRDVGEDGRQKPAATAAAPAWTEQMHSSFLDRMEAAFVHDILLVGWPAGHHHAAASRRLHHDQAAQGELMGTATSAAAPSLDRFVPDSAESTRDGRGGADPASAPGPRMMKRSRGVNIGRNGCTNRDISSIQWRSHNPAANGPKAASARRQYPLRGPPKESDGGNGGGGGGEQVVPLFQMPETAAVDTATSGGN